MADPLTDDVRRTARRIGAQTAALVVACLVVVGIVLFAVVERSQDAEIEQSLRNALPLAASGSGTDSDHDGDLSGPRGGVHTAFQQDGRLTVSPGAPEGLPDTAALADVAQTGREDQRRVDTPRGPYEVLTVPRNGGVAQAAVSLLEQHQERERILGALSVAGGAGLLLSAVAGAFLARRAVAPLARALELQRRFVADAGHELRTPLTLLSTRAQLLARRATEEPPAPDRDDLVQRDASGIVRDAAALTGILEELLTAADVRTPVPQDPVDVGAVVTDAVSAVQASAQDAGVAVLLTGLDGPLVLRGARTALARSVTALLDNAVEHARSAVEVRVVQHRDAVVVEVADDGPGIPAGVLPQMFARYESGQPAGDPATNARRHFGLGLALVSEVATRHGGRVTAENRRPGPGAVLRLRLPR